MPFKSSLYLCGGGPAQAFDEHSAWKPSAEVTRHVDLLSAQRGLFVLGDPGRNPEPPAILP